MKESEDCRSCKIEVKYYIQGAIGISYNVVNVLSFDIIRKWNEKGDAIIKIKNVPGHTCKIWERSIVNL